MRAALAVRGREYDIENPEVNGKSA